MQRFAIAIVLAALAACARGDGGAGDTAADGSANRSSSVDLTGAGATFPYPIYSKWFDQYAGRTGVRINYQSIGSGGGIRQISEETVDFGASDGPMSDDELAKAKGGPILHFPTVVGSVVITYNLPEVQQTLKLSGDVIADMFLGRITKWNDPRIAALNPGVALPARDVLVVHRSDGSGTTYVFTDYLATVSPAWRQTPGRGKELQWPVGLGGKGNEGVAGTVKQTPGAVGYVEHAYAKQNNLAMADIRNRSGAFVPSTIANVTAAAAGAIASLPANSDYRISIVDAEGATAYPISSLTWLLVYENQKDAVKGNKLKEFLRWAYAEGAASAAELGYAPLPDALRQRLMQRVDQIKTPGT